MIRSTWRPASRAGPTSLPCITWTTANLANADTPGFKAKEVRFEDTLRSMVSDKHGASLKRTNSKHLAAGGAADGNIASVGDAEGKAGLDGNNVSREQEVAKMAENQLLYRASARAVSKNLALLRYAISEGGR